MTAPDPANGSPPRDPPLTRTEKQAVAAGVAGAKKVVVAVHGIGDQYQNATIQSVVSAFGRFARYPAATPLGLFGTDASPITAFRLSGPPDPRPHLSDIGFVEVYWAGIPRKVQEEGYIIEESKAWARTIVERFRARFGDSAELRNAAGPDDQRLNLDLRQEDYAAGADAIEEMIETFGVLNNLLFIFEKLGIVKFDLDRLLTQYIGDVQIVADFAHYRRTILDKFGRVLDEICAANSEAEIYIVAHSEGTVVAFMGLLEALCDTPRPAREGRDAAMQQRDDPPRWAAQVRGLMTFGSPIDKHLVLWPDIWNAVETPHPQLLNLREQAGKIVWHNYYDYGDPVGFKLDTTRDWMDVHDWNPVFDFTEQHDHGFGRYLMPGAAHNDYWTDDAVFGHFIHNVMKLPVPEGGDSFDQPPPDRRFRRAASNVIPYLLVVGLVYVGMFLLYKGMVAYLKTPQTVPDSVRHISRNVAGLTGMLCGMIALARIPRITRAPKWIAIAIALFAVGASVYAFAENPEVQRWHAMNIFNSKLVTNLLRDTARGWFPKASPDDLRARASAGFVIATGALVAGFAAWGSRRNLRTWTSGFRAVLRPFFVGARPLVLPGGLCVFVVIAYGILFPALADPKSAGADNALWPLILASAAFLYLWWLATLLFDLVFVWHRYIRCSVANNYLYALRKARKEPVPPPS